MYLTDEQQKMLDGEMGEIVQRNMRLLVRLGDIYGAKRMIPVSSVQISGVSYKSIGDPGLDFLQDFAEKGAKVSVPAHLNPAGMDMENWKELGFPEDFAEKQEQIIDAFRSMGVNLTITCSPYLIDEIRPKKGDNIAWSESSAVSFANSVIGARTNREGGPSALAAAICGFTPEYGLHLDGNRKPQIVVDVQAQLSSASDFAALGVWAGKQVRNRIPYFTGIASASEDKLKYLGAAMAASGSVAMYHVDGITPEAGQDISGLETIAFSQEDMEQTYRELSTAEEADIIVFGCPHASIDEIREISSLLDGKKLGKPLWVCVSRHVKGEADRLGLTEIIERAGGRMVCDTCMVVSPIERMGFSTTAVNSGKAACYLPGFCRQRVVFNRMEKLLEAVE